MVLAELDGGVIEAAQASGATFWDIVGVYLSEGLPDLIRFFFLLLHYLFEYYRLVTLSINDRMGDVGS